MILCLDVLPAFGKENLKTNQVESYINAILYCSIIRNIDNSYFKIKKFQSIELAKSNAETIATGILNSAERLGYITADWVVDSMLDSEKQFTVMIGFTTIDNEQHPHNYVMIICGNTKHLMMFDTKELGAEFD